MAATTKFRRGWLANVLDLHLLAGTILGGQFGEYQCESSSKTPSGEWHSEAKTLYFRMSHKVSVTSIWTYMSGLEEGVRKTSLEQIKPAFYINSSLKISYPKGLFDKTRKLVPFTYLGWRVLDRIIKERFQGVQS
jgi:hypothetical protein